MPGEHALVKPHGASRSEMVKARREKLVMARYERIEAADQKLMEWADQGPMNLDQRAVMAGTQEKPPGWSDKKFRVACAAMLPRAMTPAALQFAHERSNSRIRKAGEHHTTNLNVQIVKIPGRREPTPEEMARAVVIDAKVKEP